MGIKPMVMYSIICNRCGKEYRNYEDHTAWFTEQDAWTDAYADDWVRLGNVSICLECVTDVDIAERDERAAAHTAWQIAHRKVLCEINIHAFGELDHLCAACYTSIAASQSRASKAEADDCCCSLTLRCAYCNFHNRYDEDRHFVCAKHTEEKTDGN